MISLISKAKWDWVREAVHEGDLLLGWLRLLLTSCGLVCYLPSDHPYT